MFGLFGRKKNVKINGTNSGRSNNGRRSVKNGHPGNHGLDLVRIKSIQPLPIRQPPPIPEPPLRSPDYKTLKYYKDNEIRKILDTKSVLSSSFNIQRLQYLKFCIEALLKEVLSETNTISQLRQAWELYDQLNTIDPNNYDLLNLKVFRKCYYDLQEIFLNMSKDVEIPEVNLPKFPIEIYQESDEEFDELNTLKDARILFRIKGKLTEKKISDVYQHH